MPENVSISKPALEDLCRRWQITEFSLFGSVLRSDFRPDSDVDVLVSFAPEAPWSLWDIVRLQDELSDLFGRTAHVVEARALRNPFRRAEILKTRKILYAA
jgi:predicted nucleotidyltransferase